MLGQTLRSVIYLIYGRNTSLIMTLIFVELNEEERRIALERAESVKYAANPVYEALYKGLRVPDRVVPFRSISALYECFTIITLVPAAILIYTTFNG